MAAHSKPSGKPEKQSTKQTKQPITPEEAAELLVSALSYCEEAKLIVEGYNETEGLHLFVRGVKFVDGKIIVTPIGVTSVTTGVTLVTP